MTGNTQIKALTSLRFFAASYVLLFHSGGPTISASSLAPTPLKNFFANGYLGVSFFFVLSGFILTYVYQGKLATRGEIATFALARFARVYPVYLLSLVAMTPFVAPGWLLGDFPQFFALQSWLSQHIAGSAGVSNWNMQSWTLSVELFFYICFPFVLRLMAGMDRSRLMALLFLLCSVIIAGRLSACVDTKSFLFGWMDFTPVPLLRTPEFLLGMLLCLLRGKIGTHSRFAFVGVLAAIPILLCLTSSLWIAPFATLFFAALIFLTPTSPDAGKIAKFLASDTMVLLGGASYSLYLLQLPIHSIVMALTPQSHEWVGRALYFPILLVASVLVFLFYEEPLRRRIKNLVTAAPNPSHALSKA